MWLRLCVVVLAIGLATTTTLLVLASTRVEEPARVEELQPIRPIPTPTVAPTATPTITPLPTYTLVPTRTPLPIIYITATPIPLPTSTIDPLATIRAQVMAGAERARAFATERAEERALESIHATAIAAATERAGKPLATPYPTYVPVPTPGSGGDITGRYEEHIAKVAAKLGVPNPNVTVVDYNLSALAQLHISPALVASRPELGGFYYRRANMIVLITPLSKLLDGFVLWHEVTHSLLVPPDCRGMARLSEEESICVHNRHFLYSEKKVWQAFNLITNRDIDYGVFDSCEQAMAAARQPALRTILRRGDSGSGRGIPVVHVNNALDADADGVVCETGGS